MTGIVFPEDFEADDGAGAGDRGALLGGKANALLALRAANLPIPPWFAVTPDAIVDGDALAAAVARLCPNGERVAVRSSATDEDGAQHSFAGQLESYLFVQPEDAAQRIADVRASGCTERIRTYRRERGLTGAPNTPAVLVQRMVDADAAGVAFSADPASGRRDHCVVAAVYGLGTALVGGDADADTFTVDRTGRIADRKIAEKRIAHRIGEGGVSGVMAVPIDADQANIPAIGDADVARIAKLARRAAAYFGRAQDIEWALADGELFLLQSRPITTLKGVADPGGERRIWDNSNIAESYGGVTTPLTFSFALRAYAEVYREFCRLLGVAEEVIEAYDSTFDNMLGLIRGRIYYNLINWYRLLALLPGFTANRKFMEQMMGVKEELPPEAIGITPPATAGDLRRDRIRLARSVFGLIAAHRRLPTDIGRFHARLNDALGGGTAARLETMRLDELTGHYRDLESRLLKRWDAPLVNDFFAMIYYGVLAKLCKSWCGDEAGSLQNDLLCGQGGMISAEPARMVQEMARTAASDPQLTAALCDAPLPTLLRAIACRPDFEKQYRSYLDKFGDRCLSELKLESPTLHDDPLLLLRSIGQLAKAPARANPPLPTAGKEEGENLEPSREAERRVAEALGGNPLRRGVFRWILGHARERLRGRENLRFERTRVFGRVRRIFVEIGRRLVEIDALEEPRDVFFLRVEEILGFVEGAAPTADLKRLVAARKPEFEAYSAGPAPADRFETFGAVYAGNAFKAAAKEEPGAASDGDTRRGIACCPGNVRARVRIVRDPRSAALQPGEILVAERTDPGWIMLFAAACGLLVERGSLLSHSAIVSREMGIPSIVSVPGVTSWLQDGDIVELDGAAGVVRKCRPGAHP